MHCTFMQLNHFTMREAALDASIIDATPGPATVMPLMKMCKMMLVTATAEATTTTMMQLHLKHL